MASKITPELLDMLSFELEIRGEYPDSGDMIVNVGEQRRLFEALVWAGDEIAQLREDLAGSMGAVLSLTMENEVASANVDHLARLVANPLRTVLA